MRKYYNFCTVLVFYFLLSTAYVHGQIGDKKTQKDSNGYVYTYFENDPIQLRIYTLENGLNVYLAPDNRTPRIQTSIVVKAGSRHDPANATGLAHYLEHLLFHGTDKLGALDAQMEKPLLQEIKTLFEEYRETSDEEKKKDIYATIDSVSNIASRYGIPGELRSMLIEMGGRNINAFTNFDRTGYVSNIPSNQLEKWVALEAERFRNPQFRAFHTQLEAVFEEMNTIIDNGPRYALFQFFETIFENHRYGTQTAIGQIEHIKNPSLVEIDKYYKNFYVPNNMAIILAGDFDPEKAIQFIADDFSYMKYRKVPAVSVTKERPLKKPKVRTITAPGAEMFRMGYLFDGVGSYAERMTELIDIILMNGDAGIFDININKAQKAQNVSTYKEDLADYTMHIITATPKAGQTLVELKDLILSEIENLRNGNFPDWLVEAGVNQLLLRRMSSMFSNGGKYGLILDSYSFDVPWNKKLEEIEELKNITKQEIVNFAKEHYRGDNYAIVYKKTGLDEKVKKIEKPTITPISLNDDKKSEFRKGLDQLKTAPLEPDFLDFSKDLEIVQLNNRVEVAATENNVNDYFAINIMFNYARNHNKYMDLADDYFKVAGTTKFSAAELQQEFFKLGCSYDMVVNADETTVFLWGLAENFEKAIQLLEHALSEIDSSNDEALEKLVERTLKRRVNMKKNKNTIRTYASNRILYGEHSTLKNVPSEEELKVLKAKKIGEKITKLFNYDHRIIYFGPEKISSLKTKLEKNLETVDNPEKINRSERFTYQNFESNKIYFIDSGTQQTDIVFWANLGAFDTEKVGMIELFNQYFSILFFGEIRESRGLAYSAFGRINTPTYSDRSFLFRSYIGTQSDKYASALKAGYELIRNLPFDERQFENAKKAKLEQLRSSRLINFSIVNEYRKSKRLDIDFDLRAKIYDVVEKMDMDDLKRFYETSLKNEPMHILLVGDKSRIDLMGLENYGEVLNLSLGDIFGF